MGIIIGLVVLVASVTTVANAQRAEWREIHESANTQFTAMDCLDRRNCVVVGNDGGLSTFMLLTSDGGITWESIIIEAYSAVPRFFPTYPRSVSYRSPNTIAIGGDSGVIWMTRDRGLTFEKTRTVLARTEEINMVDADRGFLGNDYGVSITSDGWKTWKRVDLPDSLEPYGGSSVALAPDGSAYVHIYSSLTRTSRLAVLDRDGILRDIRPMAPFGSRLAMTEDGVLVACGGKIIDTRTGLSRLNVAMSRDSGRTWQTSLDTMAGSGLAAIAVHFANSKFGVVSTPAMSVWSTTDGGTRWMPDTVKAPSGGISLIDMRCFDDGTCLGIMGRNYIVQRFAPVAALSGGQAPREKRELQIIPNPSTGSVRLWWADPLRGASVRVMISDLTGQRLLDHTMTRQEEGIDLSIEGLAPGVYFLKLRSGRGVAGAVLRVE